MSGRPENEFPTVADLYEVLAELVATGFAALPVQVVVAPDSTLQALARHAGAKDDDKPALMIEFESAEGRIPVSFISTERLSSNKPRAAMQ